ncbi:MULTISPECIES: DUF4345 domain-containing protein [unclassified Tenacibaculum]|uniref:DUF4345 domain-containing protein n=1 Tax=unclassified Tenacibaculum TaxID=2635139 RepID=UPI001F34C443|nr:MULTISPECIES: DUF4345 domain-containing protein [unclassified Tenacibaculum]MCF2876440.1 DUF4345 domain-containing protein [Tenacibaculum sp. Cn5-1]MCF2936417.1 DUF4345 domain-containing protein [Tenacibaculum sp. Cn5-34]MCG7512858.1 DUF4345 domain-containing protein [Tenacibaculum sp. Cn5-46]
MEIFKIITLALSGSLLLFVGIMRLSNPIKTYLKNSGVQLEEDANLLNEMRGVSGVMLLGGIIILLGTMVSELTFTSFVVAILIFLGFGIGRVLSIKFDGKPNKLIIQGLISEFILASLNLICLISLIAL